MKSIENDADTMEMMKEVASFMAKKLSDNQRFITLVIEEPGTINCTSNVTKSCLVELLQKSADGLGSKDEYKTGE